MRVAAINYCTSRDRAFFKSLQFVLRDLTDRTKEPINLDWLGNNDPSLLCNTWHLSWNRNQKLNLMEVYYDDRKI